MSKKWIYILSGVLTLGVIAGGVLYSFLFSGNTTDVLSDGYFYIRTDDSWKDVLRDLKEEEVVRNVESFELVADQMNLPQTFKPGRYKIAEGVSNVALVRTLRSGEWEKVVIKVKAEMGRDSVVNYLAESLQASSEDIRSALASDQVVESGFDKESVWCIFLADHYHFNWATTGEDVVKRFLDEYKRFWNDDRKAKAREIGLSPKKVCILATIVDGEAVHLSEMPTIAGLYLNRLERDMLLQADPTVLYVAGREGRRRVLNRDLRKVDPYNTYLNRGLPPGPIMLPDKRAIAACLAPEDHNYIFMCARPDDTYYHNFTASAAQHTLNAIAYRRYLNSQGIMR